MFKRLSQYVTDLYYTLIGVPSEAEIKAISSRARQDRLRHEAVYGRPIIGHMPSTTELMCESPRTYRNYMGLEKALERNRNRTNH